MVQVKIPNRDPNDKTPWESFAVPANFVHENKFSKRLCDKGLFRNEGGMVSSRMTKEEYTSAQSEKFVEDTFGGSLPAFMAAFTKRRQLTDSEIEEIQRMIQQMGRE